MFKLFQKRQSAIVNEMVPTITNSGSDNRIMRGKAALRRCVFDIIGSNNFIRIMGGCELSNVRFSIRGDNHKIIIRKCCRFSDGSVIMEGTGCEFDLGRFTTIENAHFAATEQNTRIHIGKRCMFAYGIEVRTGDSHSVLDRETGKRLNHAEDVWIGDHVWITAGCKILKGARIPADSIVATGSIVTKSFDQEGEGIIVGGSPSKVIKRGVTWCREKIPKDPA